LRMPAAVPLRGPRDAAVRAGAVTLLCGRAPPGAGAGAAAAPGGVVRRGRRRGARAPAARPARRCHPLQPLATNPTQTSPRPSLCVCVLRTNHPGAPAGPCRARGDAHPAPRESRNSRRTCGFPRIGSRRWSPRRAPPPPQGVLERSRTFSILLVYVEPSLILPMRVEFPGAATNRRPHPGRDGRVHGAAGAGAADAEQRAVHRPGAVDRPPPGRPATSLLRVVLIFNRK
jgi:hypothetical protein